MLLQAFTRILPARNIPVFIGLPGYFFGRKNSAVGQKNHSQGTLIEYTSRSLTPSEHNWTQIEKEILAVVYGLEHC